MNANDCDIDPNALVGDAEYVVDQIVRGEVLEGDALAQAQPSIQAVSKALVACRKTDPPTPESLQNLSDALGKLMVLLSPITVQTLRDTDGAGSIRRGSGGGSAPSGPFRFDAFLPRRGRRPEAYRFSSFFFWLTIVIVVIAVMSNYWSTDGSTIPLFKFATLNLKAVGGLIAPFTYGAMGACVFLLRTLHQHIYGRTFDRRREPEYFNRILLGAISGGAIVLLLQGSKSSGARGADVTAISYNALGFLAGYNTDLLFSAIERITNAVFPKTPDQNAPNAPMAALLGGALKGTGSGNASTGGKDQDGQKPDATPDPGKTADPNKTPDADKASSQNLSKPTP